MVWLVLIALGLVAVIGWCFTRPFRMPEQSIQMTEKRWAELLDLQRRQEGP